MWMEEKIGERINLNRTTEAVATGAQQIAVGCPFCRVMLSDGLTSLQAGGQADDSVEVADVAQLLLASVQRGGESDEASDRQRTNSPTPSDLAAPLGWPPHLLPSEVMVRTKAL